MKNFLEGFTGQFTSLNINPYELGRPQKLATHNLSFGENLPSICPEKSANRPYARFLAPRCGYGKRDFESETK